jgi:hypothetical protein
MNNIDKNFTDNNSESKLIAELKEICSENNIWIHIDSVRETLEILKRETPIILDVTFIESKFACLDMFLRKIQIIMQIPKPSKNYHLRNWHGSIGPWVDNDPQSTLESLSRNNYAMRENR